MSLPVALVTGCTQGGIGYSLCKELVKQGCQVFATARNVSSMGDLESLGCSLIALDVTNQESINNAVEKVIADAGRIDILINNAGCPAVGTLMDIDYEVVNRCINTNVIGVLSVCRAFVPHMVKQKSGKIVNIGSIVGYSATPLAGIYSLSKAAVHSMTDVLRMELKPFGIDVVLVAPGGIKSNFGTAGVTSPLVPEDSLYRSIADNIYARANLSQDGGTDTDVFAKHVITRVLGKSPSYITYGSSSFVALILYYMPTFIKDYAFSKRFGLDKIKV
ncbi:short-chain dehydrogenase/reductase family protein [Phycomyces nitens]|nr:short-chain dehydrogenase/reductase family protein [Phycomyces nitens]